MRNVIFTRLAVLFALVMLTGCDNVFIESKPLQPTPPQPPFLRSSVSSSKSTLSPISAPSSTGSLLERIGSGGLLEKGDPKAPLTLIVFTNESCSYCFQFWRDIVPMLRADYLVTGKLRLQVAILPIRKYPTSALETSALYCAGKQGKGFAMHGQLFGIAQRNENSILHEAKILGIDLNAFAPCLHSDEAAANTESERILAERLGVTLVPTLVLNGEKKVGLPSYEDMNAWLQTTLEK